MPQESSSLSRGCTASLSSVCTFQDCSVENRNVLRGAGCRNGLVVDGENDVAGFDARLVRGGIGDRAGDQNSRRRAIGFHKGLHREADRGALDRAVLDQKLCDLAGKIRGDGTADGADAHFIDTDDLTLQIDERTSGISWKNHSIVTDPAHQFTDCFAIQGKASAGRDHFGVGDDPFGDGLRKTGGATHRQHDIADFHIVGIPECRNRKFHVGIAQVVAIQFENGEVRQRIGADQGGTTLLAIRKSNGQARRPSCDVVIGENVAIRVDDRTGPRAAVFLHASATTGFRDDMDPHQRGINRVESQLYVGCLLCMVGHDACTKARHDKKQLFHLRGV